MSEKSEETIKCRSCGNPVSFHRRTCHVCESDIGFPNVRQAEREEPQLRDRYASAQASAKARGITKQLKGFEASFAQSKAVLARSSKQVIELIGSDNMLIATFAKQVRQGARLAENNSWDRGRESAESAVHPQYSDEIHYAVLSLTSLGAPYYGNCHIVLTSELIEKRTSLFEENPFLFMNRHQVIAGVRIPEGYRAVWSNRGMLAVAKLHSKIESTTTDANYQNILISGDGPEVDFIEAHIYGAIHAKTFSKITFFGQQSAVDKALLKAHRRKIKELGIEISEEAA